MRTDCTIDNKQIRCPHLVPSGFDKWIAKRGDVIRYLDYDGHRYARVLGRVSAPATVDTPAVNGWALCMVLSENGHSAYERWVDPTSIVQICAPAPNMAAFFHGPLNHGVNVLRKVMDGGWITEGGLGMAESPLNQNKGEAIIYASRKLNNSLNWWYSNPDRTGEQGPFANASEAAAQARADGYTRGKRERIAT